MCVTLVYACVYRTREQILDLLTCVRFVHACVYISVYITHEHALDLLMCATFVYACAYLTREPIFDTSSCEITSNTQYGVRNTAPARQDLFMHVCT